eukprot:6181632-Karenia_brevis.AAC.1
MEEFNHVDVHLNGFSSQHNALASDTFNMKNSNSQESVASQSSPALFVSITDDNLSMKNPSSQ